MSPVSCHLLVLNSHERIFLRLTKKNRKEKQNSSTVCCFNISNTVVILLPVCSLENTV